MTTYDAFPFTIINNPIWRATLTKLQQVIMDRTHGTVKFSSYGDPTITATLNSVSEAVESAFILVEKATLPEVGSVIRVNNKRSFAFKGEPWMPTEVNVGASSKAARNAAAKWLSIAAHIEAEEKVEAKKKADAEAAAKLARANRLGELAYEHFGKDFDDLGPNKTSAVEEIYRLEQELADRIVELADSEDAA